MIKMCTQNNVTTRLRIRVVSIGSLLILASHCNDFSNKTGKIISVESTSSEFAEILLRLRASRKI